LQVQFALSPNGPVSKSYRDSKPKFYKKFSLSDASSNFIRLKHFVPDVMFFSFSAVRLARYFRSCLTGQRCFYAA